MKTGVELQIRAPQAHCQMKGSFHLQTKTSEILSEM